MELPSVPDVGLAVMIVLMVALLAVFGVAVYLLIKLVRMASVVRSEAMPVQGKVAFWAALAYTVLPVDLLMDPVYLDDVGVLAAALTYLGHLARRLGDEDPPAAGTGAGRRGRQPLRRALDEG